MHLAMWEMPESRLNLSALNSCKKYSINIEKWLRTAEYNNCKRNASKGLVIQCRILEKQDERYLQYFSELSKNISVHLGHHLY